MFTLFNALRNNNNLVIYKYFCFGKQLTQIIIRGGQSQFETGRTEPNRSGYVRLPKFGSNDCKLAEFGSKDSTSAEFSLRTVRLRVIVVGLVRDKLKILRFG